MKRITFLALAAGKGTRMKSSLPKVLQPLAGEPMLSRLIRTLGSIRGSRIVCVAGYGEAEVRATLPPRVEVVRQWPPRGTGDAVMKARTAVGLRGTVVVLPGDAPLISVATLRRLLVRHRASKAAVTVLTVELAEPGAYGRIVRDGAGRVRGIVEAADANARELAIREINTGIYAFEAAQLYRALAQVGRNNAKGEYYLTDVIALLSASQCVESVRVENIQEVQGVNTLEELAQMEQTVQSKLRSKLMARGVRMPDPRAVYLEPAVRVAAQAVLLPGTHLCGKTIIGAGAQIGPDCQIRDSRIGPGARVRYSVLDGAHVGAESSVGPFAHLRPGSRIGRGVKIGNFVEIKKSTIGDAAHVSHLTYVGDASIGKAANVGAGTITCNYDGVRKHKTRIGAGAFIGSNTALVAPVSVGAGAVVGAGSVITKNVPARALAVARGKQFNKANWAKRKRGAS